MKIARLTCATLALIAVSAAALADGDPGPSPTLQAAPPDNTEGVLILFNGTSWDAWVQDDGQPSQWKVQDDRSVLVHNGNAISKHEFRDAHIHLEFYCPESGKEGQARSNSGVYIHGRYEVQVLDSFGDPPLGNGCGALYSIASPAVNACRPADHWQTYDIIFRAPRVSESGEVTANGRLTVLHNGVVIHNNIELPHHTPGGIGQDVVASGPLMLQDHGDPVRYRNIWIRDL